MEVKQAMTHQGSLIRLRPEYEERYIILHKHTFPGVLSQINKVNIRNYSIFLLEGILFSHYEYIGNDYANDMKAIADETTMEWWKLTDPMQELLPTGKKGEWWASMEQLSLIEENTKPYSEVKRHAWTAEIKPGTEITIKDFLLNVEKQLIQFFRQHHFQNQNIYFKDDKLYIYIEYTGNDFSKDVQEFNNIREVKKWNEKYEKNLITVWKKMNEVFHTN